MRFSLLCILFFLSSAVFAGAGSSHNNEIVGRWVTFNKKTKRPSSIILMTERHGRVEGKIIKTFPNSGEKKIAFCQNCPGDRKNKPILGLTIIKDMLCHDGRCTKGNILDPRDGNVYHATMQLIEDGRYLKVRGYIGIPLFGKTVVWARMISKRKTH